MGDPRNGAGGETRRRFWAEEGTELCRGAQRAGRQRGLEFRAEPQLGRRDESRPRGLQQKLDSRGKPRKPRRLLAGMAGPGLHVTLLRQCVLRLSWRKTSRRNALKIKTGKIGQTWSLSGYGEREASRMPPTCFLQGDGGSTRGQKRQEAEQERRCMGGSG